MAVHVGLLTIDLRIPEARTLKDKRQVLHSLLDRLAVRFRVSVAEVGHNDLPRRAQIAVAAVSNGDRHVEEVLDAALALVESEPRAEVVATQRERF